MSDGRSNTPTPPATGEENCVIGPVADRVTEKLCWAFVLIGWLFIVGQVLRAVMP